MVYHLDTDVNLTETLRRSFDKADNKTAIHMVSAWYEMNQMVLGQLATDVKSNEITAIPKLLELLDLTGAVVTIDAMGCRVARKPSLARSPTVARITCSRSRRTNPPFMTL